MKVRMIALKVIEHGDCQKPVLDGNIKFRCKSCGCKCIFEEGKDSSYMTFLTNVCGEIHETTKTHADIVQIKCPDCGHVTEIAISELKPRHTKDYYFGSLLMFLSILNAMPIADVSLDNPGFGVAISLTIISSVIVFMFGRSIRTSNQTKIIDIK